MTFIFSVIVSFRFLDDFITSGTAVCFTSRHAVAAAAAAAALIETPMLFFENSLIQASLREKLEKKKEGK